MVSSTIGPARPLSPVAIAARAVLTVVVGLPYLIGWTAGKVWLGMTLLGSAIALGWREALHGGPESDVGA